MIRLLIAMAALGAAINAAPAAQVTYYDLPEGANPHDVAPAPDGTVWFTGQRQGFLGRFDPKTGNVEKVPLGPGAAPHGVIVGPDGAAWVTEGGQNAIARVDPATKAVKLFPLPKEFRRRQPQHASPSTRSGVLWFTGQSGVYGRVDPDLRQGRGLEGAEGLRPLRHHHDAVGRCLVRLACRRLTSGASTPRAAP